MSNGVRTRIVKIGNLRGFVVPKPLLAAAGIEGAVEMSIKKEALVIRAVRAPRDGWKAQFRAMAARGDDRVPDGEVLAPTRFDEDEWEW